MQRTARNGGLIMMHAENGPAIDVVAGDEVAAGRTDPYYHGVARYPIFEGEATNRVIRLAEAAGAPVYIVHLSARDALDEVRAARDRGSRRLRRDLPAVPVPVAGRPGRRLRGREVRLLAAAAARADHQAELWTGLVKDDLQLVATDHCPFDFHGQKELGRGDFRKIPNGLPGVEDRVDLLHDGGVVGGRITPRALGRAHLDRAGPDVRPLPAQGRGGRRLRRRPRHLRPAARHTISATTHHMDVDYSCYEGRTVTGRSAVVLSRGEVIVRDGAFLGASGRGRFLRRSPATFAREN